MKTRQFFVLVAACILFPRVAAAQGLTGALIGSVKDEQGGVLPGAFVRVTSPALIGRELASTTNDKGQLRFPVLPPGTYALDIESAGFATYHEEDIRIGAGATIERTAVLRVAGVAESLTVQGAGSRIEARGSGFEKTTNNFFASTFGQPTVFMNPRRVMVSARLNVGR